MLKMVGSAGASFAALVVIFAAPVAMAIPTLDGVRDVEYGSPITVQTVQTDFTDNADELNAAYASFGNGNLYLLLTGQVNNNFNKLNIFIDSKAGGQSVLQNADGFGGNNPTNDNWAAKYAGFTFDNPFAADYLIIARNGNSGGNRFDIDFATIGGGAAAFLAAGNIFSGSLTGSNASALANGIGVGYNNSNVAGITGGINAANQAAAAAVTTGIELVIPLSTIGSPGIGDVILVSAMINGTNHDYLSNQFLGGLAPPQIRLGGDGLGGFNGTVGQLNMNNFTGDQYFRIQVVPEPAVLALLSLATLTFHRSQRSASKNPRVVRP